MSLNHFEFVGRIPSSKSETLRSLVFKSFFPKVELDFSSRGDDVQELKSNLEKLNKGETQFKCHLGAAPFRFLALRLARLKGEFFITASPELLKRPHESLIQCLSQLSVEAEFSSKGLKLVSQGWSPVGDAIHLNCSQTSQVLSALVLNSWNFEKDIFISTQDIVSRPYFDLTLSQVRSWGMSVKELGQGQFVIPKLQKTDIQALQVSLDMDSAFFISALALISGQAQILNFAQESAHPSFRFLNVLESMKASIKVDKDKLHIKKTDLAAVNVNLKDSIDMAPVLASLVLFSKGVSKITGLKNLAFKESNRLEKIYELLEKTGAQVEKTQDELLIVGQSFDSNCQFEFNSSSDHRMVMAAQVLKAGGLNIEIEDFSSISKSFPEFEGGLL